MRTFKIEDTVTVLGSYSGIRTQGRVVKVSPGGKQISVELPGRSIPSVFNYRPTLGRHFSEYDGYLFTNLV